MEVNWEKDADALHSVASLRHISVVVGGYTLPFDEGTPVTPQSEQALQFGSRVALFGNLRRLFLNQTLYLAITIILSQGLQKKIINDGTPSLPQGIMASDAAK